MLIDDKKIVQIEYTLKNAAGEVIDSSVGGEPLSYLHGAHQIVPGLERELSGLKVGDVKDVVVTPDEGYGSRDPQGVFFVPRTAFPPEMDLSSGQSFVGESEDGEAVPVRIIEVHEAEVVVDANHPLAGETLYFHIDIRGIREATSEELTHGHPHDGQHHH